MERQRNAVEGVWILVGQWAVGSGQWANFLQDKVTI